MRIHLYTSGKVEPKNTQHGGWSVVMLATDNDGNNIGTKVLSGYEYGVTAYSAQMIAVYEALHALTKAHDSVVIYGRNETLMKAISGDWKASVNKELMATIQDLIAHHKQVELTTITKDMIDDTPLQQEADKLAIKACYEGAKNG